MTSEHPGRWYLASFLVAAGAHAALFAAIPSRPPAVAIAADEAAPSVEVELVAVVEEPESEPEPEPVAELPPEPTPPPEPEPTPEPPPEPTPPPPVPVSTPEMALPEPTATPPPPKPKPKVAPAPKKPAPPAKAPPKPAAGPSKPSGAIREAKPDAPRNRPPHYPETARRNGWHGRVIVRATVSEAGRVSHVELRRSSGYGALDQSALQAVRGWRFLPRTVGGQPVGATIDVPVTFSLRP